MIYDWKEVVQPLYQKIKPEKGILYNKFFNPIKECKSVGSLWIVLQLNDFTFFEPFYENDENSKKYEIEILLDLFIKIDTIKDLENREFYYKKEEQVGHFASFGITVPYCKFGKIENNMIDFEMEYILTNGPECGSIDGSIKEHIELSGRLNLPVTIISLIQILQSESQIDVNNYYFNKEVYKIKESEISNKLNSGYIGSDLIELEVI